MSSEEDTHIGVWYCKSENIKEAREWFEWDVKEWIDELYFDNVKPMKLVVYETLNGFMREHISSDSFSEELGFKSIYCEQ